MAEDAAADDPDCAEHAVKAAAVRTAHAASANFLVIVDDMVPSSH